MQIVVAFIASISHTRAFITTSTATIRVMIEFERMTVERMVDFLWKLGTGFMNRKFTGATTIRWALETCLTLTYIANDNNIIITHLLFIENQIVLVAAMFQFISFKLLLRDHTTHVNGVVFTLCTTIKWMPGFSFSAANLTKRIIRFSYGKRFGGSKGERMFMMMFIHNCLW